jgi:hypothetical protein
VVTIIGDTSVSINIYNYFLIILDDYTLAHMNDGLVTTSGHESSISSRSNSSSTSRRCDPTTGAQSTAGFNPGSSGNSSSGEARQMTAAQIYSANQILANDPPVQHQYSQGVFIQDIFGIVPMNTAKIASGQSYIEFGGSLQLQDRNYFGPVNITKMRIRLLNDKGVLVDLNNANWSISLTVEKLYSRNKI